ncbi:MAG: sterol desaturase family protein [Tistlia sp.]|uniref:sterol desaturase family protein n=1 Tax=Tistlia sp. TaxID=3057121 RepID=UPI0034A1B08B
MESLQQELVTWKGFAVAVWLAALFLAERLRPAARPAPPAPGEPAGGAGRLLRNAGLWSLTLLLSVLVVVPLTWWAAEQALGWRPAWWQGAGGLLLDLLVLDLLIYWWHRANHELPLLWRFHEVHHLDRFLDTTSALRFHAGEVLLSAAARALVVLLLGFPFVSVLVFETLVLTATLFHHSNLRLPGGLERALSRVVITPSIHWVHHHARRRDTDSNYGTILSIWDPLFGTRSPTARTPGMAIGVEGRRERSLGALLLQPFAPRAEIAAPAKLPARE